MTSPSSNQLLQYNGSKWVNVSIFPASTIVGISDTQTLTNNYKCTIWWLCFISSTANAIAGGTTTTGAHQSLTTATANQLLISNGSAALPSWITNLTVAQGGTGLASTTAYGVLCGGASTTGN